MADDNGLVPSLEQVRGFVVNRNGIEAVRQRLYDSVQYPTAGATNLSFFSLPIGQGTSWTGSGAKNESDTNMTLAGQLPANQWFLVQSMEVGFFPATPTAAAGMPSAFAAAAVTATNVNDQYIFRRSGNLKLGIGSKNYLQEAPLASFPLKADFDISAALADSSTSTGGGQTRVTWGKSVGRPYMLSRPPLLLESSQNFNVSLNWPEGVQAITNTARVMVIMDGILYRRSQ